MVFEGQGGPVGFGQGSSSVTLREMPDGATELSYTARAQVGGKLAQVGSRLIDSVARKLSDDFFKAFLRQFKPVEEPGETTAERGSAPSLSATPGVLPTPAAATPTQPGPVPRIEERPARVPVAALPRPTLVPGWWLAIAAALGSALTLSGLLAVH